MAKKGSFDKLVLGAVIGAAIGSVIGASVTRKKKFDVMPKISDDKPKSLLRRIRLYLKDYNERNQR